MSNAAEAIRLYIIHPDRNGLHLRQLAEKMAADEPGPKGYITAELRERKVAQAAAVIARFIHMVWGGSAGPETYAPRIYEILLSLQGRMRGMPPHDAWEYALAALGEDIRLRLKKAGRMTIDPDMETSLMHSFFDSLEEHQYLRDVAEKVMDLHWHRRHGPGAITTEEVGRAHKTLELRGEEKIERHLRQVAREGLATYIEQANIGWGNIDHPYDPVIVLRDRIEVQISLGGKNAHTWEESAWRLADLIERRFGTTAARREARAARAAWGAAEAPGGGA
jgi:hypothetical protein